MTGSLSNATTRLPFAASELLVHDDAIRANAALFAAKTGGRLMAVLKADAFGHGPIASSVLEAGAQSIGVASVGEALTLRASGVDAPILSWLNPIDAAFDSAVAADIDLAVPSPDLLHAVGKAARATGKRARVHLHIDVGMARDGCPVQSWSALCRLAREAEHLGLLHVVGIMGHLSCADTPEHPQNDRERLIFTNAVRTALRTGLSPTVKHLAATAATLHNPKLPGGIHRIGAGLYGIDPSGRSRDLHPALSLTTGVVSSRPITAGAGVGYGLDHVAGARSHLALLPLGYGDGLPRSASGRAEVSARGRRRPLVGRFSMDMVVVDTGDDLLHPGETVTIFGPGAQGEPTVSEWANWAGTIDHEIVTRLGSRISRIHRTSSHREHPHD